MKLNLVKEIMACLVCPVCKTFSSSSNNTLNAHIDRCLSGESSMKSPESPKIKTVKHRIKPRKTRLMLDIYKTAPHCTIEDLDRRNGTNWATNSSFPDQELEFEAEENNVEPQKPTFIPEIAEHEDHEGAVYIDTHGTKVRILSMRNFSKLDNNETWKLQKGGKRIKFVTKKKKGDGQKYHRKVLKLSLNSKMFSKKATNGQEENVAIEKSCNKEDLAITRPPWACSKRTGLAKKTTISSMEKNIPSASQEHNAGSKFNLKRKFQDSLKQKSRMEEDTSRKLSFDQTVNDLEVPFQESFMGLRNSMDGEFSKMVTQLDNKFDKQGSYFDDVDPIPIPGPPGSFLPPSPGVVSEEEEVQGNSSLTTTSRFQSSGQDHHHHDMMNRDFISDSPISNVSSPSYAKSSDKLSVRFTSPQDKKSVNTSDLRSVDAIFTKRGPTPCCCSRKEGAYQESSERVLESNSLKRSDLLSLTLPPPDVFKSRVESSVKLPVTPTTPVLRLMGKNLIVVNTDEEQFRAPFGGHQQLHNIQNENHNNSLFYGYPPHHGSMPQYYNYHPPNYARSLSDLRPVHANCNRLDAKMASDVNKDNTLSKTTKDIIVIDDSSENEAD